jgi:NADH-quinone oxidoreductase subunit E
MAVRRLAETQPDGFAFTAGNRDWAEGQIAKFPEGRQASAVISLLWRAQEQEGWVTKPAIEYIAAMLDMPTIRVLEVATFYTMFHLAPVGAKAHVQVCGTTPCMLRGSDGLIDVCRRRIHHDPHHVSADGAFSWEEVECLGACVNAPMVQIFGDTYEDLTPESFEALLDAFARGERPRPGPQNGRHYSLPITGPTTLTEIAYAEDDVRQWPAGGAPAPTPVHAGGRPDLGEPREQREKHPGGEMLEAELARRSGRTVAPQGTDPAAAETANQEAARVNPSGRSDEAASRAMGARAAGQGEAPPETRTEPASTRSGERNPEPKSDSDSGDGSREGGRES